MSQSHITTLLYAFFKTFFSSSLATFVSSRVWPYMVKVTFWEEASSRPLLSAGEPRVRSGGGGGGTTDRPSNNMGPESTNYAVRLFLSFFLVSIYFTLFGEQERSLY